MDVLLEKSKLKNNEVIYISGSKSETNRLLLLQALYPELILENASASDDSIVMKNCLESSSCIKDVHHAGTAMRFLISYYSCLEGKEVILTGSERMKERPVHALVNALHDLGADITYLEKTGYPPVRIKGKKLEAHKVEIAANVSSQYISSLMLIAPSLAKGLKIILIDTVTSRPYIQMTAQILNKLGAEIHFDDRILNISPLKRPLLNRFRIESDWSSASYFYSLIALSPLETCLKLSWFHSDSLQGDALLSELYKDFGVNTVFEKDSVVLRKAHFPHKNHFEYNLNNTPDIAQTIAVTCLGLGVTCRLTGLHTLKIKETDRLAAMRNELEKFGAVVFIDEDSLNIQNTVKELPHNKAVATYNDHRMAMAFAPLSLKTKILIEEADVVTKSYPDFWNDLKKLGVKIKEC